MFKRNELYHMIEASNNQLSRLKERVLELEEEQWNSKTPNGTYDIKFKHHRYGVKFGNELLIKLNRNKTITYKFGGSYNILNSCKNVFISKKYNIIYVSNKEEEDDQYLIIVDDKLVSIPDPIFLCKFGCVNYNWQEMKKEIK